VNIKPVGKAAIIEDSLIDDILEARLILSKNLIIGNAQLGLVLFGFLLPICN